MVDPIKFGVVFPQIEFGNDPAAIKDYAQAAEALGFTHILAYDHILGANPERPGGWEGPYTHRNPFHEVFCLFSFMAAATEKIGFTTGILILPQRETALAAKQAAELDVLSSGRLRLGVAIGWNPVEYTAMNQDFSQRAKRLEEQVDLMRRLWTEPLVTYQGQWHHIDDAGINPLPVQQPIPIWFGGHAKPALRRMAKLGDGWLPNYATASDAREALNYLEEQLSLNGRKMTAFGIEPRIRYGDGSADVWQRIVTDWTAAGATHFTLNTMYRGFDTPQKHIRAMRDFVERMME